MKQLIVKTIDIYQATRFLRRPSCRFYPSCSSYLKQAVLAHGCLAGILLGFMRLLRCHPLHAGGVDEVPNKFYLNLR